MTDRPTTAHEWDKRHRGDPLMVTHAHALDMVRAAEAAAYEEGKRDSTSYVDALKCRLEWEAAAYERGQRIGRNDAIQKFDEAYNGMNHLSHSEIVREIQLRPLRPWDQVKHE